MEEAEAFHTRACQGFNGPLFGSHSARRVLEQVAPALTPCYANADSTDTFQGPTALFATTKGNLS